MTEKWEIRVPSNEDGKEGPAGDFVRRHEFFGKKAVENAIGDGVLFMRSVFDAITDGISILDADFRIVRVNASMERLFSQNARLTGRKCHEVYQRRDAPCPWCPSLKAMETGETQSSIVPYPSEKQRIGWIDLSAFPLKDRRGKVIGVIEYVKDITRQVDSEKNLLRHSAVINGINRILKEALENGSREKLGKTCVEAAKKLTGSKFGFIAEIGDDGRLTMVDSRDGVHDVSTASDIFDRLEESAGPGLKKFCEKIFRDGAGFLTNDPEANFFRAGEKPPGSLRSFMGAPLKRAGKTVGIAAVAGKKRGYREEDFRALEALGVAIVQAFSHQSAEESMRKSDERFRSVLENSRDAIYRRNLENDRLEYMSPTIEKIIGFTPEEMIGMDTRSIFERVHPGDRDNIFNKLKKIKTGGSTLLECRFKAKDGRYKWLSDTVYVSFPAKGRPRYRDGIVRDITARKIAEKKLLELNETLEVRVAERTRELEKRNRELQRLALEISKAEDRERERIARFMHDDLQQHLAALKLRLDTILSSGGDPEDISEKIRVCIDLAGESIEKTRKLSRELNPPVLYQFGFIQSLDLLAEEMRKKHGLETRIVKYVDAEPHSRVLSSILFHSIRELLFNVVKHSGTRSADVEVRAENDWIVIRVRDSGKGFDVERVKSKREFEPGFGLFSIEERIGYLGGKAVIESAPGKGCLIVIAIHKDAGNIRADTPEPSR